MLFRKFSNYICPVQKTIKAMDKSITKKIYYNTGILNVLQKKYGYSIDYIRKSLRGDRVGVMPDEIKKEYKALEAAAQKAIEDKANN